MKSALAKTLVLPSIALFVSCETPASPSSDYDSVAFLQPSKVPAAARQELARARAATARYHDVNRAIADGYVDISLNVPGQGMHYLNASLVDGTFDPEQPELLQYVQRGNKLKLVGVEYVVPLELSASAPAGFSGDADQWHVVAEAGLWALHTWIWLGNPDGIFADTNSKVP
jgi:hypothetical protein